MPVNPGLPPLTRRLTRRRFLLAAVALAASVPFAGCAPDAGSQPQPGGTLRTFTPREWATLDAAGRTLWPDLPGLPGAGATGAALRGDALLAGANPRILADLRQLLGYLESMTWLRGHLTPFTDLDDRDRARYLLAWRDGLFPIQRQAYAALVRLTGLLTYVGPASWPGIGYPGPWIGRIDIGPVTNPNPNVYARWEAPDAG